MKDFLTPLTIVKQAKLCFSSLGCFHPNTKFFVTINWPSFSVYWSFYDLKVKNWFFRANSFYDRQLASKYFWSDFSGKKTFFKANRDFLSERSRSSINKKTPSSGSVRKNMTQVLTWFEVEQQMAAAAVKEDLTSQPEMPFLQSRKEREIILKRFLIIFIKIIIIFIIILKMGHTWLF